MTYLETGVYRLSTLSPIHIRAAGDQEKYGQGFIRLNDTDDFLYVVDTPKLQAEIFASKGLNAVDVYTEAFSNPDSKTNIVDVLKQIGYDYESNIKKISKGIVRIPSGNRFIASGLGEHFIPGSSIKGAIKTAVLFNTICAGTFDLDHFVDNRIKEYLAIEHPNDPDKQRSEREIFKRNFAEPLLKKFIQSLQPSEYYQNKDRNPEDNESFKDLFKAIKIKDATIIDRSIDLSRFAKTITSPDSNGCTLKTLAGSKIQLPSDKIFKYQKGGGRLRKNEWIQINTFEDRGGQQIVATFMKVNGPPIKSGNILKSENILLTTLNKNNQVTKGPNMQSECFHDKTTIEISIDHEILESFKRSFDKAGVTLPFCDLKSLIQLCQNFAQAQWEAERQFLAKYGSSGSVNLDKIKLFYADDENKKRATLRVGWGTGMLGTTVSLLLNEPGRVQLRKHVISGGRHTSSAPAPRSRRFVLENGQPVYPLGWIELT